MTEENKLKVVSVRLVQDAPIISRNRIKTPADAVQAIGYEMRQLDREAICVLNLNSSKRPLSCSFISLGTVDSAITSPREVFKQALLSNASSILLMHNHPGGDPEPSHDDLVITEKLAEAGKLMGIPLVDHVIVGDVDYCSLAEKGYLESGMVVHIPSNDDWPSGSVHENPTGYAGSNKIKEITDQLEAGVKDLFESNRYRNYLDVMSRFHNYSAANCLLIAMQKPDATHVAGLMAWNRNFGRQVNKGEKAIRIIAPCPYKKEVEVKKLDETGKEYDSKEIVSGTRYKITYVFDLSQTSGKELPEIVNKLQGDIENYKEIKEALIASSPVPVSSKHIPGAANGYYDTAKKEIVLDSGLSEKQELKTLIHEIAHARLHDKDNGIEKDNLPGRNAKEVEAESVAYTVSRHYGLDTGEYSFGYIAGWSSGRDMAELKHSLSIIRDTSAGLIKDIDSHLGIRDSLMESNVLTAADAVHISI